MFQSPTYVYFYLLICLYLLFYLFVCIYYLFVNLNNFFFFIKRMVRSKETIKMEEDNCLNWDTELLYLYRLMDYSNNLQTLPTE